MFTLKPKESYHGKNLKRWYRRVSMALIGELRLPKDWTDRPSVSIPSDKLSDVMNCLYKQFI